MFFEGWLYLLVIVAVRALAVVCIAVIVAMGVMAIWKWRRGE